MSDELKDLQGMSEPFCFEFSLCKNGNMLCHSVIFSSFEMFGGSKRSVNLPNMESDPRMKAFAKYLITNFLQEEAKSLKQDLVSINAELEDRGNTLAQIKEELKQIKREVKQ